MEERQQLASYIVHPGHHLRRDNTRFIRQITAAASLRYRCPKTFEQFPPFLACHPVKINRYPAGILIYEGTSQPRFLGRTVGDGYMIDLWWKHYECT
ncbi:hypothetical protein MMS95_13135 [Serratia sp. PGPR-27]|uniref:hypothetical protein n=1 Tax=Serratia TaxID=613 RepID=UPI000CCBF738|nr:MULTISPECIES: hypothetical protein [Serratia]MCI2403756.1 hypothetical protein [Serratia sp. PGPR-27]PNU32145.1 hypothetical protein C2M07_08565 [Serratia marcescens]PNU49732.1 hypothetical protein C2M03_07240 [Serratia marcescens]HAT5009354.1 hypothetical protein [Serratia marcescens]